VSFKDEPRHPFDEARQPFGRLRVVGEDEVVAELDPWLHHHGHHTLPGSFDALLGKRPPGHLDRLPHVLDGRDLDPVFVHLGAARRRHLCPDDVAENGQPSGIGVRLFGGAGQHRCPAGHDLGLESTGSRVIPEMHAGIQMDLRVARADACAHQRGRLLHRLGGRQALPDQRAEMIAS